MTRPLFRAAALLASAAMLSGCMVDVSGISFGSSRKTVRGKGEDVYLIDVLPSADAAGDHTLSIEDVYFTDGGIELTIDPSLADSITLKGPQNLLDSLDVSIDHEAGIIRVTGDDRRQFAGADLEITLGVPVKSLSVAGGVELDASLPDVKAFALEVDGAVDGDITFGALDTLDVEINGAGDLELSGSCAEADIEINGAGAIDADHLICTNARVEINGAGSCDIHVTSILDAAVNGVGSIRYSGSPATVNKSGGGIVAVSEK